MFTCRKDEGFVYEEEIYYEEGIKLMQLGCFSCGHKVYVEYKQWEDFKKKIDKNLYEIRMSRRAGRNLNSR